MSSDWIIGALALITIGGVLALSIFHFGFYLKDPKNLEAFRRVAEDRRSAMTAMSSELVNGRCLRQRLDDAPSIEDGLGGRPVNAIGPWGVMMDTDWSHWRAALKSNMRG